MYCPQHFTMRDSELFPFIQDNPFASLISNQTNQSGKFEPLATQLPFIVSTDLKSSAPCLFTHMAANNPQSHMCNGDKVLIIFNGKHQYQSPLDYLKHPAVPTWNYSSVQVRGIIRHITEAETKKNLTDMISQFEPALLDRDDVMPIAYVDKLLKAIIGFKVEQLELIGKNKWGQNKVFANKSVS